MISADSISAGKILGMVKQAEMTCFKKKTHLFYNYFVKTGKTHTKNSWFMKRLLERINQPFVEWNTPKWFRELIGVQ